MSSHDDDELIDLLAKHSGNGLKEGHNPMRQIATRGDSTPVYGQYDDNDEEATLKGLCQWTTSDNKRFVPASKTCGSLIPGVYEIMHSQNIGIYFEKVQVITEGLLRFPQTNSEKVVTEIQKFWDREHLFKEYGLVYKRGIILWGPPGSGKSSIIQIIMKDVVERGGIVVKFGHPSMFTEGMRILREIEPDTPVVVLMEDIDSIISMFNESDVLNILDGVDKVNKCVFLATTNYPENLGARIMNRPSRFDKRFKIGHPNKESRLLYLKHIIGSEERIKALGIEIDRWVNDTNGFSIAHLKELFVAVVILGDEYSTAVKTLTKMREKRISSEEDERTGSMGFVSRSWEDEDDDL